MIYLDPSIWGPHYWFFLHTIAFTYPNHPNSNTKKIYYNFFRNFPLFIPVNEVSSTFSDILNKYPILPYLDNKKSLIKWVHFVHNKINRKLEKPIVSIEEFYKQYYELYKPKTEKNIEFLKFRKNIIIIFLLFVLLFIAYKSFYY